MPVVARPFPKALPHGELQEVLPSLYFVTGTVGLPGPLPVRFSRAMTVVKEGDRLVIVNSVRLNDAGLRALDALGKVTDVVRIASNHGMDDPFYKDRYGAKVWAVKGQRYLPGFARDAPNDYFAADVEMDASTPLPIAGCKLVIIDSTPAEGLLLLERSNGTIVSGDCLQNWGTADEYINLLGRLVMRPMGFLQPHNIGPGWLKQCKPPKAQLAALLDLPFENVLPCHGKTVIGAARTKYRPRIEQLTSG